MMPPQKCKQNQPKRIKEMPKYGNYPPPGHLHRIEAVQKSVDILAALVRIEPNPGQPNQPQENVQEMKPGEQKYQGVRGYVHSGTGMKHPYPTGDLQEPEGKPQAESKGQPMVAEAVALGPEAGLGKKESGRRKQDGKGAVAERGRKGYGFPDLGMNPGKKHQHEEKEKQNRSQNRQSGHGQVGISP